MNIQMVDLRGQYLRIKDEIDAAVAQVLDSAHFIRGPVVSRFEAALAEYTKAEYAIGVANGTDALQIAYMALGIGPGDEIITPSFTFIATAEAAALLGAVPVFADIDPDTFCLDPASVEACITPQTRAIVPVHLFGQSADMDPITALSSQHNLAVIEDNAQAIGATYRDIPTGSMGTMATCSFFPSKNLGAYGDGGAILTSDPELEAQSRMITNHGGRHKYYNEVIGLNSRLDALQAAILEVKLRHLESFTERRRTAAAYYHSLFEDVDEIVCPHEVPWGRHVYHQYVIRVKKREELANYLSQAGIPHGIYYPVPLHRQPVFGAESNQKALPETERACDEVLALPMHTELTPAQQELIAEKVIDHATHLIYA
ncbi:MAG: DegT/DnrJ/EryC1/StrS family aminotransferase [Rhodothermaceae bacterium]|nr:DegT/DnrJ/EryC1/StrS family aminotransferase [Rhodothermaceae bacterium]MYG69438.1 DegT/DnrJ/EryC1/StrS family aminotransferase [Rhodothermaceae bacterium]MYJ45559.1 DegT/DnrJ/EryC1/StrS family aminotransferase [Rhodothermaceae bacterium]